MLCTMCMHGVNKNATWNCMCGDSHCQHIDVCKRCRMTRARSYRLANEHIKIYKPDSRAWERAANNLARQWCSIYPCNKCGAPVVRGYVCPNCHDDNPGDDD